MTTSLASLLAVDQIGNDEYSSRALPVTMGNTATIAYGGSTLGVAIHAAFSTVPNTHKLYSLLGHFLGPTSPDKAVRCRVTRTRDTRSFATRRVEVEQTQRDGASRVVMELTADFHILEVGQFQYSMPVSMAYSSPHLSLRLRDFKLQNTVLVESGAITANQLDVVKAAFETNERYFDIRFPPECKSTQIFAGLSSLATQDGDTLASRSSVEWYLIKERLKSEKEQLGVLAFLMDGGLDTLPLEHSHEFVDDIRACSSLDFALRVFQPSVDLNQWHIRERKTSVGGIGRTYSESRLWNEQNQMVARPASPGYPVPTKRALSRSRSNQVGKRGKGRTNKSTWNEARGPDEESGEKVCDSSYHEIWHCKHCDSMEKPNSVTTNLSRARKQLRDFHGIRVTFNQHKQGLIENFDNSLLSMVHFTIDMWTSSEQRAAYQAIMAHFVDAETRQVPQALLSLREFNGGHAGEL
ncbi:hypothetical protein NLG97_g2647 [Lecanicillium saksenae]|uniref:Uncharacterized protein n=1 Tax=Lecanicillium saksenae TaxID=468837 RepID=A0ACC1R0B2_9HYPO|nr:hypothetical protein NLG97_g2647 [Lecanicillium saksenae]